MKYFDANKNCLVFIESKSTPKLWDDLWNNEDLGKAAKAVSDRSFLRRFTVKYLKKGSKVLEGGCGKGQYVSALKRWGFDSYGVDYAESTVEKIRNVFPDLQVCVGDVRRLPFADNFFDGYWSLGVIEHFYEGFDSIALEMRRVLKDGGYLFVTFPYMSPLRRFKAKLGLYSIFGEKRDILLNDFYQFALDERGVKKIFGELGFVFQEAYPFDGVKGLKDELGSSYFLQKIYDSNLFCLKMVRKLLNMILNWFSSHSVLLVFKLKK